MLPEYPAGRLSVDELSTPTVAAENGPDLSQDLLTDRTDAIAVRLEW